MIGGHEFACLENGNSREVLGHQRVKFIVGFGGWVINVSNSLLGLVVVVRLLRGLTLRSGPFRACWTVEDVWWRGW
jgi:hypothetical protein